VGTAVAQADPRLVRLTLLKAAAICERGWTQCDYFKTDSNGNDYCCISEALCRATLGIGLRCPQFYRAQAFDVLYRVIPSQSAVDWNDAPERTQAEVVQALRDAADLAAEEERRWP
jgi:hypothetical protein